jgi:hypothetical protein
MRMFLKGLVTTERLEGWSGAFHWTRLCLWIWRTPRSEPRFALAS